MDDLSFQHHCVTLTDFYNSFISSHSIHSHLQNINRKSFDDLAALEEKWNDFLKANQIFLNFVTQLLPFHKLNESQKNQVGSLTRLAEQNLENAYKITYAILEEPQHILAEFEFRAMETALKDDNSIIDSFLNEIPAAYQDNSKNTSEVAGSPPNNGHVSDYANPVSPQVTSSRPASPASYNPAFFSDASIDPNGDEYKLPTQSEAEKLLLQSLEQGLEEWESRCSI